MTSWISLLTDRICACNPILASDFRQWLWQPGMCFLDDRLWWGEQKSALLLMKVLIWSAMRITRKKSAGLGLLQIR
ncbi:MAG: hypothetical protein D3922_15510 [Candidatus Electrothrix sp. AR1]|nr:hypothetical protein [Candidatus Electrothrix sp. AR1]